MFKNCELNWEQMQGRATRMLMGKNKPFWKKKIQTKKQQTQNQKESIWFSLTKEKEGNGIILSHI